MSGDRLSEIRERLFALERKMRPLAWDMERNQINEFRKVELGKLKQEQASLQVELTYLETQMFINTEPASPES